MSARSDRMEEILATLNSDPLDPTKNFDQLEALKDELMNDPSVDKKDTHGDGYVLRYIAYTLCTRYAQLMNYPSIAANKLAEFNEKALNNAQDIWAHLTPEIKTENAGFKEQFVSETTRIAGNTIAWNIYKTAKSLAELETALPYIDKANNSIIGTESFYIRDTYARLLLRIADVAKQEGQDKAHDEYKKQAFSLMQKTIKQMPGFRDIDDLLKNEEYIAFNKQNRGPVSERIKDKKPFEAVKSAEMQIDKYEGTENPIVHILSYEDAKSEYKIPDEFPSHIGDVLVFRENTLIRGDFNRWVLQKMQEHQFAGRIIVFGGTLCVRGCISDIEHPANDTVYCLVEGDVCCKRLMNTNHVLWLNRNCYVQHLLQGCAGYGLLTIRGRLEAPFIHNKGHDSRIKPTHNCIIFSEGNNLINFDFVAEDYEQVLSEKVLNDGKLELDALYKMLQEGEWPLLPAIEYISKADDAITRVEDVQLDLPVAEAEPASQDSKSAEKGVLGFFKGIFKK